MCTLQSLDDSAAYKASGDITSRGDKSVLVADSRRLSHNVRQPRRIPRARALAGSQRPISERPEASEETV